MKRGQRQEKNKRKFQKSIDKQTQDMLLYIKYFSRKNKGYKWVSNLGKMTKNKGKKQLLIFILKKIKNF